MSNISPLKTFLEDKAAFMKAAYSLPDWKYGGFEELVLSCGIEMEAIPLPDTIKPGMPQQCYWNCQQVISKHKNLIYVEGYAVRQGEGLLFPTFHAWLMTEQQQAIDPTWGTLGIYYLGITLASDWVKSVLKSRKKKGKVRDLSILEGNYLENNSLLKYGFPTDACFYQKA